jgi:hypothetical protein
MFPEDFVLNKIALEADIRFEGLSTDARPSTHEDGSPIDPGAEWRSTDTGIWEHWDGTTWQRTTFTQKLDQLIELQIETRDLLRELLS